MLLERVVGACARTRGLRCPGSSLDASIPPHCRYRLSLYRYILLYPLACLSASLLSDICLISPLT